MTSYSQIKLIILLSFLFTSVMFSQNNSTVLEYNLPKNKQGIADLNHNILNSKRYKIYEDELNIGIQKYGYYWRGAENSVPSSKKLMVCKEGYVLFPKSKKQKNLLKISNYHCYKKNFIKKWQTIFEKNLQHNIQVSITFWTTPKQYRNKGCEGFYFPLQKRHLYGGCYPKPEHYDDYEDWVKFTAHTFGKYVDHYIIWNEVEMVNWADTTTKELSRQKMIENPEFYKQRSFNIYTELLKRSIESINELDKRCMGRQGECKNLVYVSLTGDWYSRDISIRKSKKGNIRIKWRNMNLLDHIWGELGLEYDWAIAVHPYGSANGKSEKALRFSTLKDLSAYQKTQINARKEKGYSWLSYPQSKLFASEQNVGNKVKADDWKRKARFICESYDVAQQMPELIAITHNHFQDNIKSKNKKPTKHTMLPASVQADLSNADKYETFLAYKSTSLSNWRHNNNHYCCKIHKLGCKEN